MTQQGNYQNLIMLEADIIRQSEQSPAFAFFNREKIKNFYSKNNMRLNTAKKKLNEFMEEHIKKDEKGEFMKIDNNGNLEWVFLTEADKEDYQAKFESLMTRPIEIHC